MHKRGQGDLATVELIHLPQIYDKKVYEALVTQVIQWSSVHYEARFHRYPNYLVLELLDNAELLR